MSACGIFLIPASRFGFSSIHTDAQFSSLRLDLGLIATGGRGGHVNLWNLDGTPHGDALVGHDKAVYAVAFSPDKPLLASGGEDGTLRIWNLDGSPHAATRKVYEQAITSIATRGDLWVSGSLDGTVRLWNSDGMQIGPPFKTDGKGVLSVALSPDGKTVVSGAKDGSLCLWRLDKPDEVHFLRGHDKDVFSVTFNVRGDLIASASSDGSLRLWNSDGSPHGNPITDYGEVFTSVAFSPSAEVLTAVTASSSVRVWSMQPAQYGPPQKGYSGYISPVAFSPNGRLLASVGKDGTVRISDLTGKLSGSPLRGPRFPRALSFSPTGDVLATAGESYAKPGDKSTIELWDTKGAKLREIDSDRDAQTVALAFSQKGQFLAALDFDGFVRLWSISGVMLGTIPPSGTGAVNPHGYPKGFVAISRDDTVLAFVGQDATAQLWRLAPDPSHKVLQRIASIAHIAVLALSPVANLLATASQAEGAGAIAEFRSAVWMVSQCKTFRTNLVLKYRH